MTFSLPSMSCLLKLPINQLPMATAMKTTLENKHLGNGYSFVIIACSSHPLLLTKHAAIGLAKAPLK